jgi:hypothetical protein
MYSRSEARVKLPSSAMADRPRARQSDSRGYPLTEKLEFGLISRSRE